MKKLLLLVLAVISFSSVAVASDCFNDPVYDLDWNAVVTTGAFVRDVACMEGSVVKTTAALHSVVHVIAETDGWYKVELSNGTTGWVGQWLIEKTNQGFNENVVDMDTLVDVNVDENEYIGDMYDIYGHLYEGSIWSLFNDGIIHGYSDGGFKPDSTLNRAELLKIVIEAAYTSDEFDDSSDACFSDVKSADWFSKYVCYAKKNNIVKGYSNGTFLPASEITIAEALKISMISFGLQQDEGDGFWYEYYVDTAEHFNFIPSDIIALYGDSDLSIFNNKITRGQMANLIDLIRKYDGGFDL